MAEINLGKVVGPQGEKGEAGKDGTTPHIDSTSRNWFLGETDTGIKAEGEDGVSIESIVQTKESEEDGGTNIIEVTLSDGAKSSFRVRNGHGGGTSEGANGRDGVSVDSVVQTTTSNEDGGTNVITVTLSDGGKSTFQVKNGSKGSTGERGVAGVNGKDGMSPLITENAENSEEVYKLDIASAGTIFTTPNLKGAKGVDSTKTEEIMEKLGGLAFAMDEEGKWGYITPGADAVIPFKNGEGGVQGVDSLFTKTTYAGAGTPGVTSESIVLEKKYKMIIGIGICSTYYQTSANLYPTVNLDLRNSGEIKDISVYSSWATHARFCVLIKFDTQLDDLSAGDDYAFTHQLYMSQATNFRTVQLLGLY